MQPNTKKINLSKCNICPLKCHANRKAGAMGLCGANDKLLVSRCALHYWEEPVISGVTSKHDADKGPGSGAIFFPNCSIRCYYCQNYKISGVSSVPVGKEISVDYLSDACIDLQNKGAMNINFVTGTHYRDYIIESVKIAKNKGLEIPIVWNTSGYETTETIDKLSKIVDVWLTDFKYSNNKVGISLSRNKVIDYFDVALCALNQMYKHSPKVQYDTFENNSRIISGVIVRHLVLPNMIENSKSVLRVVYNLFGNSVLYSIMNQYTPPNKLDKEFALQYCSFFNKVSSDEYNDVLDYADKLGIDNYFWQYQSASDKSFIPSFE